MNFSGFVESEITRLTNELTRLGFPEEVAQKAARVAIEGYLSSGETESDSEQGLQALKRLNDQN